MSSKLLDENLPFIFVLNKLDGEPILGVFSSNSEKKINLNQSNILTIPQLIENSFKLIEKIKTIYKIVPKKIIISACKSEYGTATIINYKDSYLDLPKKFLSNKENQHFFEENLHIDSKVIENLQEELSSIILTTNSQQIKPLNTAINYMYNSLNKYFSFISVFNNVGNCLTSTLGLNRQENVLVRQLFDNITNKNQISEITNNVEQNLFYKQLGNVFIFYFYLKGKFFFLCSIDIEINIGITKLKLLAYIKNNLNDIVSILENLDSNNSKIDLHSPQNDDNDSNKENLKITLEIS